VKSTLLSVLVPVYNEEEFVAAALERVMQAPLPPGMEREVVVVDDGSTDGSAEAVQAVAVRYPAIRLVRHGANRGKGAAVRTALEHARGEFSIIQDADLEYDPRQFGVVLKPLVEGRADAVYGSRFLVAGERRVLYFWHALANWLLTMLCNVAADLNLTDIYTCYKAFRTSLGRSIPIRSDGFTFELEFTIKLAKREARIYEVPISYYGRTYDEGKKIRPWDAVPAFLAIPRFWLSGDIYTDSGPAILDAFSDAKRFNRWMADTIRPYVGKSVLEIGAGMGNLTRHLIARRRRYIATDIDEEHLARLSAGLWHRPNLEVRVCDLAAARDFDWLEGAVDTAICLNVLEHVAEAEAGARNLYRALEPGGCAIVLAPQGQWAYGKIDEALGHVKRYSGVELRGVLEAAGFRVERVLEFNRVSLPGWYLNGKLLGRATISPFQLRQFDRGVWLWRRIDRFLPWGPASIIAIARKPSA
jgi:glycosyltransferase involved in cell wall biosynthesis